MLAAHIPRNRRRTPCAQKHDRLGWEDGFVVSLEGLTFGVRSNRADFLPRLREFFPSSARPAEGVEVDLLLSFRYGGTTNRKGVTNYHLVYDAWNQVARSLDLESALGAFQESLQGHLYRLSPEKLYFDGSLLHWLDRQCLVVGPVEGRREVADRLVLEGAHRVQEPAALTEDQRPDLLLLACSFCQQPLVLTPGRVTLELLSSAFAASTRPVKTLARLARLGCALPAYQVSAERLGVVRELCGVAKR